jgi:protein SCO1
MVSVDPGRDTPEKLHEYVRYFNPEFRGVTGEFLTVHQLATSLNIPFAKVPGGGENYQVEHSGNIALINPNGHYVGFFKSPHELDKLLRNYQSIRISRG